MLSGSVSFASIKRTFRGRVSLKSSLVACGMVFARTNKPAPPLRESIGTKFYHNPEELSQIMISVACVTLLESSIG